MCLDSVTTPGTARGLLLKKDLAPGSPLQAAEECPGWVVLQLG